MQKEKLLKDLLKTLLDNSLNKLEKKHNEEMKDYQINKVILYKTRGINKITNANKKNRSIK